MHYGGVLYSIKVQFSHTFEIELKSRIRNTWRSKSGVHKLQKSKTELLGKELELIV